MTPAERARIIDQQEFAAECADVRQRALAYVEQRRQATRDEIANWLGREPPKINRRAYPKPSKATMPRPPKEVELPKEKPKRKSRKGTGKRFTIDGLSLTKHEWADYLGINYNALCTRAHRLGSFEAAVAMGERRSTIVTIDGRTKTISEWADHFGVPRSTFYYRLKGERNLEAAVVERLINLPGVVSNLGAFEGTGAGSTAQETPNITFSGTEACPQ